MDANSKDGLLALLGLLSIIYGLGMAFFTWLSPQSPYYPIFKPRWRFGVRASRHAAFIQVPEYISLGGILMCAAFHSKHAQIFAWLFIASAVLGVVMFVLDWASADES